MRRRRRPVKSGGDDSQLRALAALLLDDLARIIEAAAALHFAAEAGIGLLRRRGAGARRLADLALGQPIADAHDHAPYIALMRRVRNYTSLHQLQAGPDVVH